MKTLLTFTILFIGTPSFAQYYSDDNQKDYYQDTQQQDQGFPSSDEYASSQADPSQEGRMTFDISLSSGSTGNVSYTEINLGINYFFNDWLNWRNSAFYRDTSTSDASINVDDVYGLDTSLRSYLALPFGEEGALTFFGGPGARIPSEGDVTAFAEGGAVINASGITFGLGAKRLFNSINDSEVDDETVYFVTLSGSGNI